MFILNENKTANPNEKNEQVKKQAKPKQENKKPGLMSFLKDCKAETKKIIWPDRAEVFKKTGTVIFTSLLVGAILFAMDSVYSTLLNLVFNAL